MEIVLLGAVGLVEGEELLQVRGSTQRQLLAILAARRRAVVGADWLADTLGLSPGGLRASIARLRRVVGADVVVSRSRGYVFATDAVDIAAFESLLAAAKGRDPPLRESILAQALGVLGRGFAGICSLSAARI
jgi:biotin operon repressor